jgi:hypothetical protein
MQTRIEVEGLDQLRRVLAQMPPLVAQRVIVLAVGRGARVIARGIAADAPFATGRRSVSSRTLGHLRDNVRASRLRRSKLAALYSISTGAAFWGQFLAIGTKRMHPPPYPDWFRKSFQRHAEPALAELRAALGRGIERTATELAGRLGALRAVTRRLIIRGR